MCAPREIPMSPSASVSYSVIPSEKNTHQELQDTSLFSVILAEGDMF